MCKLKAGAVFIVECVLFAESTDYQYFIITRQELYKHLFFRMLQVGEKRSDVV